MSGNQHGTCRHQRWQDYPIPVRQEPEHRSLQGFSAGHHFQGFFITNIVWKSRQLHHPHHIIEFDAGFNEPKDGKGFKYNVRGVYRNINGSHTSTLRQIPKEEKPPYFDLLEQTARQVLSTLTDDLGPSETLPS